MRKNIPVTQETSALTSLRPFSLAAAAGWYKHIVLGVKTQFLVENAWYFKRTAFGREGGGW